MSSKKNPIQTDTIKEVICIKPHMLHDIKQYIQKICENKQSECTKEYGYILSIENIKYNPKCRISRFNENIYCTLHYTIEYLKPTIGHQYKATIQNVFEKGICCIYKNIFILIPSNTLTHWTYYPNKFVKSTIKQTWELQINDIVTVEITNTHYNNNVYKCIATLIKKN